MEHHDIVIIGGGLAGLSLAKFLAEKNLDVILLEEHDGFFRKACGEGVGTHFKNYDFLELYGSKKGIEREVEGIEIRTKYGKAFFRAPLFVVDKREVEEEFARQAQRLGADIRLKEKVREIIPGHRIMIHPQGISSKIVVGADGVFSRVRKTMGQGLPSSAVGISGITPMIEREKDRCYLEYDNSVVRYGYTWFFPKKDTWNIGIGSLHPHGMKDAFQRFKTQYTASEWKGGYGPISKPLTLAQNNLFLVGDSGAQIRSTIGAGNLTSIISAHILAETLARYATNNYASLQGKDYETAWDKILGTVLRREYYITSLMKKIQNNEYLLHLCITNLARITSRYV
jgi:flavin-dependent dehydrogenase